MAKSVHTTWRGFAAQHRYEDFALIADVLTTVRPTLAIELGTAEGGFAAFLEDTVKMWDGRVVSFDHRLPERVAELRSPHLTIVQADLLTGYPIQVILDLLTARQIAVLYCDNGNKVKEIETYAPYVQVGSLLGCHDYEDEVPSAWVEPYLHALGYRQHRHAEFAALAHPDWYPVSMTRFWQRIAVPDLSLPIDTIVSPLGG